MGVEFLPEKVRQSALARALEDKLSVQQPVNFDYWGEFKRLRERVATHMREMQRLFPWYTPHDEEYHLVRLFGIADNMLGPGRYAQMNAAELFLIACGLYAHDWGMAVGTDEIIYLRSGGKIAVTGDVFVPLDDEVDRLHDFADRHGLRTPTTGGFPELEDDYLRVYIRHTHAWRSGVRVRAFFKAAGGSVPQALERVCQGHWLGFSELDDEVRFPTQCSVLGHNVNLRAIGLYVRLVDLFDIADDRTPYAIWRFVAPRDSRAQMEWNKHRALSPVTFPTYGDGRAVRFDGSTSDPEVWAELEDLRQYCEDQLASTNDLFARHRDERHQLDLRKIDWAVAPERFKPINIRFKFHRRRMFEILSSEIYQGDSHVFLRELLQNSIDAVRMRRELVRRSVASSGIRREVGLGFDDAIYFTIQHLDDGGAIVRCSDSGIGMDEYVVRNYLAVAGVSYYQSDDFRHLGLRMDPISRFGIGILSCFMVADRVEIETFRDPRLPTEAKPLRFDIPAVDLQFRCYPGKAGAQVGTAVTVHVLGTKLKSRERLEEQNRAPSQPTRLHVTDYLAAVAGFVEFPIVVDEGGIRKVILHPNRSATDAQQEFSREEENIEVRQLSRDYPWDKLFVPQDAGAAAKYLRARTFDLHRDLCLQDYEGWVSYAMPKEEDWHLDWKRRAEVTIDYQVEEEKSVVELRLDRHLQSKSGISPSSSRSPTLVVYRDGILVADPPPSRDGSRSSSTRSWPRPVLLVNLPKQFAGSVDVTRRTLKETSTIWEHQIWSEVANRLRGEEFSQALRMEPPARLDRLASLVCIYWLNDEELVELVPAELWPGPMLTESGEVIIDDLPFRLEHTFWEVPLRLEDAMWSQLGWTSFTRKFGFLLQNWRGGRAVALDRSFSLHGLHELWMRVTESRHQTRLVSLRVRFLSAPLPGFTPLPQAEFISIEPSEVDETTLWESAMHDPHSLTVAQRCAIRNPGIRGYEQYELTPVFDAVPFAAPFSDYFAWGGKYLNLNHPTACALFRCAAALRWCRRVSKKSEPDLGEIDDRLLAVVEALRFGPSKDLGLKFTQLWELVRRHDLFELQQEPPGLEVNDYVWGSTQKRLIELSSLSDEGSDSTKNWFLEYLRPFGQTLTSATPEELPERLRFLEQVKIP